VRVGDLGGVGVALSPAVSRSAVIARHGEAHDTTRWSMVAFKDDEAGLGKRRPAGLDISRQFRAEPDNVGVSGVCTDVIYRQGDGMVPSTRMTFLGGTALGSMLTVAIALSVRVAASGPRGAGAVGAVAAVVAVAVAMLTLALSCLPRQESP